jgi:mevalonate kinase
MAEVLTVEAPGKVILHGEHAVVYGKRAIAVSVGLCTRLTIRPTDEVEIKFPEVGIDTKLSLDVLRDLKTKLGPSFTYVQKLINFC